MTYLGAAGLRAVESGHVRRMLGIAFFALSAGCRSRALESGLDRGDLNEDGLAHGTTLGVGATSRGRVVSPRHPTNTGSPTIVQSASATGRRVIALFSA